MIKNIDHLDLAQTAESGQCFRWKSLGKDTYSVVAYNRCLTISRIEEGRFELDCTEDEYKEIWSHYLDVDTDYFEVERLIRKSGDSHLLEAFEKGKGIRILRQDLWEMIVSYLISQNNNIPRIKGSIEAICRKAGFLAKDSAEYRIPLPEEVQEGFFDDKSLGLGYRVEYLGKIYAYAKENPDWLEYLKTLSYEDARKELLNRKGIGPKVADCICLFGLHHVEAFPIDTHVKQLLLKYYSEGFNHEYYKEYAGIVQQYLFYYEIK